jgi:type II secretory pathway pseudopilin PulG
VIEPLEAWARPADTAHVGGRLLRRLRRDGGFGLIELLIAMVMLNIGLIAILGTFVTGSQSIRRASRIATASTLADTQMELYRALTYGAIALDAGQITGNTDNTYKCDSALGPSCPNTITTCSVSPCAAGTVPVQTCTGSPLPAQCQTSRQAPGPDHGTYRIDTYIVSRIPTGGRVVKLVTVVVRDSTNLTGPPLARRASSFDQATGT